MTRCVVILRDDAAPLWFLRCAEPCRPEGWCMERRGLPTFCYLGGCLSRGGAEKMAKAAGYEVVE